MSRKLSKSGRQRFWQRRLDQCDASGLTQVEYCRSNKISPKSFQYWKRKLNPTDSPKQSAPALVEVSLSKALSIPVSPAHPQLCVVVDRYRIEIGRGFDAEDLGRVIRTLVLL